MPSLMTTRDNGHFAPILGTHEESNKELLQEFVAEGKRLVREEVRLIRVELETLTAEAKQRLDRDLAAAKTELGRESKKAVSAVSAIGIGAVLANAALHGLLLAAAFALAVVVPLWAAFLIVTVVAGGCAALVLRGGIGRIKRVRIAPRKTIEHLQEDKRWMREKMHALGSAIRGNA